MLRAAGLEHLDLEAGHPAAVYGGIFWFCFLKDTEKIEAKTLQVLCKVLITMMRAFCAPAEVEGSGGSSDSVDLDRIIARGAVCASPLGRMRQRLQPAPGGGSAGAPTLVALRFGGGRQQQRGSNKTTLSGGTLLMTDRQALSDNASSLDSLGLRLCLANHKGYVLLPVRWIVY
jgi:hypothetical protein